MSHIKYIRFFAVLTFLMPFFGIPESWKIVFYMLAGVVIVLFTYLWKKENNLIAPPSETQPVLVQKATETLNDKLPVSNEPLKDLSPQEEGKNA